MTDPIADMLTRIRNAVQAKHARVDVPASTLKSEIARILQDEGYIAGYKLIDEPADAGQAPVKQLRLFLKYGSRGEQVIRASSALAGPAGGTSSRQRETGLGGPDQHPDDVARRHDRAGSRQVRRRRRSPVQRVVAEA
jgi:hypothetical protein